jgi:predicted porin
VGFKGQWGNVFFGNWDTPYKIVHGSVYRPFSTAGAFGNANILHNGTNSNVGNGTLGGFAATGFSRRAQNMVAFHSGDFAGFQVLGAYTGTDESTSLTTNAAPTSKPRLYSLGATWTAGPLYIGAAYEEHKSFNPGQGQAFGFGNNQYREGTDHAWEIVAAFTLGPVRLGASYHELKYETAGAAAGSQTELKYKPWAVYADWRIIGPHTLRVEYLHAPNTKGNSAVAVGSLGSPLLGDTGAQLYGIQYAYAFSKRTEVNFGYVLLDNDRNSRFALQSPARMNTCQGGPAVGCNRDQSAYVLGVIHRF